MVGYALLLHYSSVSSAFVKVIFVKEKFWPLTVLQRAAHAFRLRGPLAADPTAQMFHLLLLAITMVMFTSWIVTLPLAPITFARESIVAWLFAELVAALLVLRLGHFRAAALIHLTGSWGWATLVAGEIWFLRPTPRKHIRQSPHRKQDSRRR
jgi:hypothetical protein